MVEALVRTILFPCRKIELHWVTFIWNLLNMKLQKRKVEESFKRPILCLHLKFSYFSHQEGLGGLKVRYKENPAIWISQLELSFVSSFNPLVLPNCINKVYDNLTQCLGVLVSFLEQCVSWCFLAIFPYVLFHHGQMEEKIGSQRVTYEQN